MSCAQCCLCHSSSPPVLHTGSSCSSFCPIKCLYVHSSVVWFQLRFPHKNDVRFGFYPQLFVGVLISYLCYMCLFVNSGVNYVLTIRVTWWVSNKRQELLIPREHLGSPSVFGGARVDHLFFVFCVVLCFILFVFVPCLVYPEVFSSNYGIIILLYGDLTLPIWMNREFTCKCLYYICCNS